MLQPPSNGEMPPPGPPRVALPRALISPTVAVARRLLLACAIFAVGVGVVWVNRAGYLDPVDGKLSLLDAVYFTAVSLSSAGYGDIAPRTAAARLADTFVMTPLRLMFLIIVVGATVEALAERTRRHLRLARWRSRLRDHTVVVGYGTKGRAAVRTLLASEVPANTIVVVDVNPQAVAEANEAGLTGVIGDATRSEVLARAEVESARQVIIAPERDDTAVLVTLLARRCNAAARIVATARAAENAALLRHSGATHIITSSDAVGRLLALSTLRPSVSEVMQDLLARGTGLNLHERPVHPGEVGRPPGEAADLAVAVVRGEDIWPFDAEEVTELRAGDRLIVLRGAGRLQR